MPKLMGADATDINQSFGGFGYSTISVDKLGATEYTFVTIVVDKTGSVEPFKDQLEQMLTACIDSCKRSPRALNLLARTTAFSAVPGRRSDDIEEIHGFTLLNTIDTSKFKGTIQPNGSTPLYDAALEALDTTRDYVKKLYDDEHLFNANAIIFVITDGDDNASKSFTSSVKEAVNLIKKEEVMESIKVILIGVNDSDSHFKNRLETFKNESGIDEYISVGEVSEKKLAKLAQFISQSVSSTSQALGSGGPSQPADFKF